MENRLDTMPNTVRRMKKSLLSKAVYNDWCELVTVKGLPRMDIYQAIQEKYNLSIRSIWKYVNYQRELTEEKQAEKKVVEQVNNTEV